MKVGRFLVVVWAVGLSAPAVAQSAPDDDVIELKGASWRLHGIDLPDADQVCADGWRAGEVSRATIRKLTDGAKLACKTSGKDQYSRPVATCEVDGEDLGATLVAQGIAWAALRHTWRYLVDDWRAWFGGVGLYGHACEKPWDWRARTGAKR